MINMGGVCDDCGLPAVAHPDGRCPTPAEIGRLGEVLDRWQAAVQPHRDAYHRARHAEKNMRRRVARGTRSAVDLDAASAAADQAWGQYQAAIRAADRAAMAAQ